MPSDSSKIMNPTSPSSTPSSSRILYDIPCKVCQDHSSGKHYGIYACDGCAGFFKRSVRRSRQYACKSKRGGSCVVDKTHRNQCRACRLTKCLEAGMNRDAVQHERGPRSSTLRRQLAQLLKEPTVSSMITPSAPSPPLNQHMGLMHAPMEIGDEVTCEVAARLLFMNVRWAKQVGAFSALPLFDRVLLLVECWRELFVLGASALLPPLLMSTTSQYAYRDAVQAVSMARLDEHELACLRAIVLFQPRSRLSDPRAVAALHDHAQLVLNKYVSVAHPEKPHRFSSLMMLLPTLRTVPGSTIVEMFFKKTIGDIPIERIISDMYRNEEKES